MVEITTGPGGKGSTCMQVQGWFYLRTDSINPDAYVSIFIEFDVRRVKGETKSYTRGRVFEYVGNRIRLSEERIDHSCKEAVREEGQVTDRYLGYLVEKAAIEAFPSYVNFIRRGSGR